ncbi:UNVERIFIED_CONTAM: hypothetical protein GTU68_014007 [Idotea baltica]|nr:hypothetical protein [Idotea baltica]
MNLPEIKLFNTLSKKTEVFNAIKKNHVSIYACGPTVYNYQHIGNFRTFINEDLLRRTFLLAGYKVNFVMNITDVGHLTSDGDEGENKKSTDIANFYTEKFLNDSKSFNILESDTLCKATEHIQEMIDLIQKILDKGYAYQSAGNVYFDVSKFDKYGELANLDLEKLKAGARIEVDKNKKNNQDFVLWFTKSKFENHELLWDSPWGEGYPGWHIECSAMSLKYLGEQFDIHCGGIDHIPVHHTNEIAQTEAATGKEWVNIWFHSEFILLNEEKMSKSTGKFLTVDDLIKNNIDPLAYRLMVLGTHYKKQMNFSWDNIESNHKQITKV